MSAVITDELDVEPVSARDASFGAELVQFAGSFLPQIYLHAVVVQELATAINVQARRQLDRQIIQPFERRGRLVVPSYAAWKRSGEIIADLVERKVLSPGGVLRSFMNDVLLAVSCRENGLTIVTLNETEFRLIATVEEVHFEAPWPRGRI